jgi:hypothetical protein
VFNGSIRVSDTCGEGSNPSILTSNKCPNGFTFLLDNKNVGVRFPLSPPRSTEHASTEANGDAGCRKLDSFNFCCYISGIRIAAIASAFQAEYHRGFESHIPLHEVGTICPYSSKCCLELQMALSSNG